VQWLPRRQQQLNGGLPLVLLQQMALSIQQLIFHLVGVFLQLVGAHQVYVALHHSLLRFVDSTDAALFKDSVAYLEVFHF